MNSDDYILKGADTILNMRREENFASHQYLSLAYLTRSGSHMELFLEGHRSLVFGEER
jgi:hypothetical protein